MNERAEALQRLDLRGLDPPEPMRRALEAVESLAAGGAIDIVTDREPLLLYRELGRRGHSYATEGRPEGFLTTIRPAPKERRRMTDNPVEALADALKAVIDPELGYNIVDIGLVYELEVEDGRARVLLTTTTPGCPATHYIRQAVEERAAAVPGIAAVDVVMTWLPPWSPDRMSDEAKAHFGIAA